MTMPYGMAMSMGAGLLLAGVSFKVAANAIRIAGPAAAALAPLLGAAVFGASNALLARFDAVGSGGRSGPNAMIPASRSHSDESIHADPDDSEWVGWRAR